MGSYIAIHIPKRLQESRKESTSPKSCCDGCEFAHNLLITRPGASIHIAAYAQTKVPWESTKLPPSLTSGHRRRLMQAITALRYDQHEK